MNLLQVGPVLPAGFIDTPNEEASPYYSFETGVTIALVRMCSIPEMCSLIRIQSLIRMCFPYYKFELGVTISIGQNVFSHYNVFSHQNAFPLLNFELGVTIASAAHSYKYSIHSSLLPHFATYFTTYILHTALATHSQKYSIQCLCVQGRYRVLLQSTFEIVRIQCLYAVNLLWHSLLRFFWFQGTMFALGVLGAHSQKSLLHIYCIFTRSLLRTWLHVSLGILVAHSLKSGYGTCVEYIYQHTDFGEFHIHTHTHTQLLERSQR